MEMRRAERTLACRGAETGAFVRGQFRQATVYKGRNRDTAWYAAIDADWPALSKAFEALLSKAHRAFIPSN